MTRALVLGGGGPVGIAWEAGLLAGLAEAGVDLGAADFIVGTSAGSFVGSQVAGGRAAKAIAEAILAEEKLTAPPPGAIERQPAGSTPNLQPLFRMMEESRAGVRDPQEVRREIGAFALAAQTIDEPSFIKSFGRSLSERQEGWPGTFACTAVDAETGDFVVWDAASGVRLAEAVASSCSVPGVYPPITLKGRRYIDGGMRSATNADLARGHDLVVVVQVQVASPDPAISERMRRPLEAEIAALREAGARVETIAPDEASLTVFGPNLMNGRVRPAACRAGLAQGRALAETLKGVWS